MPKAQALTDLESPLASLNPQISASRTRGVSRLLGLRVGHHLRVRGAQLSQGLQELRPQTSPNQIPIHPGESAHQRQQKKTPEGNTEILTRALYLPPQNPPCGRLPVLVRVVPEGGLQELHALPRLRLLEGRGVRRLVQLTLKTLSSQKAKPCRPLTSTRILEPRNAWVPEARDALNPPLLWPQRGMESILLRFLASRGLREREDMRAFIHGILQV